MMFGRKRTVIRVRDTVLSRTGEQVETYLVLCLKYQEQPSCDSMGPNPHSAHADKLRLRDARENGNNDSVAFDDSKKTQEFKPVKL